MEAVGVGNAARVFWYDWFCIPIEGFRIWAWVIFPGMLEKWKITSPLDGIILFGYEAILKWWGLVGINQQIWNY